MTVLRALAVVPLALLGGLIFAGWLIKSAWFPPGGRSVHERRR